MVEIVRKPLDWFRENPSNARQVYDDDDLRRLNATLRVRQLVPVIASKEGLLYDGHRRLRAGKLGGVNGLDTRIVEEALSASEIQEISLLSLQRSDLNPYELFLGCWDWLQKTGGKAQDLAVKIGRDPSHISRILSLARCLPVIREGAASGLIGVSDWYAMSKASEQEQHEMLAAKRNGATREDLERKRKPRTVSIIRAQKVKIPLGKSIVVISGESLGMEELVELCSQLLREAKKAAEQFDIKTFCAMMRDKAKA